MGDSTGVARSSQILNTDTTIAPEKGILMKLGECVSPINQDASAHNLSHFRIATP